MRFIIATVLIAAAYAGPVPEHPEASKVPVPATKPAQLPARPGFLEHAREKRSNYPPPVYASPCAASAPVHVAPYAAHGYGYPQPHPPAYGGYGGYPHYRADEHDDFNEMMSFSDMDHMAMARSYYPPSHYGPGAVGVFPNANVGSCAVPLLLTCSPSVVQGKVVQTAAGPSVVPVSAPGPVYRGSDDHAAHDATEEVEDHMPQGQAHEERMPTHDRPMMGMHPQ